MASRMYFLVIIIFSSIYNVLGENYSNLVNKTACYGGQFFPQPCSNGSYAIHDLKFGAKNITQQCPSALGQRQNSSCCKYSPDDCFLRMPYNESLFLYNAISGNKRIIGSYLKVKWGRVSPHCQKNSRQYTNYGFLSTECVDDQTIINMGSSSISSGKKLYVLFRGTEDNTQNIYDNYTCVVRAEHGGLIVYSVDVRLQNYNLTSSSAENVTINNEEGICNNSYEVVIEDTDNTTSLKCENYTILGYNQTYFHSRKGHGVITLYIDKVTRTVPQMVWLAIEADNKNEHVEVNCNNGTYNTTTVPSTHKIQTKTPKINGSTANGFLVEKPKLDWTIILGSSVGGLIVVSVIIGSIIYISRRNARRRSQQQTRAEIRNRMTSGQQHAARQNNRRTNRTENVRRGNVPGYRDENVRRHYIPDNAHSRNIQGNNHS